MTSSEFLAMKMEGGRLANKVSYLWEGQPTNIGVICLLGQNITISEKYSLGYFEKAPSLGSPKTDSVFTQKPKFPTHFNIFELVNLASLILLVETGYIRHSRCCAAI